MESYNVQEARFCEGCNVDICERCTFDALEQSRYGELLRRNPPRFGRWAAEFENVQKFINLLGDDVDPLRHGLYQANSVAVPFINAGAETPFTRDEAKMLYIGNILHDAHEGLTGDIALPDKDLESNQREQAVNLTAVAEILGPVATDDFLHSYEAIIWDLEGWSRAGRAFKAIEVVGYLETGLRAWAARNHADLDDHERSSVADMGRTIFEMDIPLLTPFLNEFPYVRNVYERACQALDQTKMKS